MTVGEIKAIQRRAWLDGDDRVVELCNEALSGNRIAVEYLQSIVMLQKMRHTVTEVA